MEGNIGARLVYKLSQLYALKDDLDEDIMQILKEVKSPLQAGDKVRKLATAYRKHTEATMQYENAIDAFMRHAQNLGASPPFNSRSGVKLSDVGARRVPPYYANKPVLAGRLFDNRNQVTQQSAMKQAELEKIRAARLLALENGDELLTIRRRRSKPKRNVVKSSGSSGAIVNSSVGSGSTATSKRRSPRNKKAGQHALYAHMMRL